MNKKFVLLLFLISNIFIIHSCSSDSKDKTVKTNYSLQKNLKNKADSIKFETIKIHEPSNTIHYLLDTVKSRIEWSCDINNGYVKFKKGIIGVSNKKIIDGTFIVCMDSIVDLDIDYDLMRGTLEKILKSADFFNISQYPNSIFKIDSTKQLSKKDFFISGYMKIFNIVNQVGFNSGFKIKNDTLIAKSQKFSIDRTKWGLTVYTKDHIKNEQGFIIPKQIFLKIYIKAFTERH